MDTDELLCKKYGGMGLNGFIFKKSKWKSKYEKDKKNLRPLNSTANPANLHLDWTLVLSSAMKYPIFYYFETTYMEFTFMLWLSLGLSMTFLFKSASTYCGTVSKSSVGMFDLFFSFYGGRE